MIVDFLPRAHRRQVVVDDAGFRFRQRRTTLFRAPRAVFAGRYRRTYAENVARRAMAGVSRWGSRPSDDRYRARSYAEAKANVSVISRRCAQKGRPVFEAARENSDDAQGMADRATLLCPRLARLGKLRPELEKEVFGPVLHVVRL